MKYNLEVVHDKSSLWEQAKWQNNLYWYLKVKTSWSDTEVTYTNPSNSNKYTVLQLVAPFCAYSAKKKTPTKS